MLERIKATGNAISEFDNYFKLSNINETACRDRLRGFYGEQHGDWNKANDDADTAMMLLEAMSKREIKFKEAYKAEKDMNNQLEADALLA